MWTHLLCLGVGTLRPRTCDGFLDPLTWSQWAVGSFWCLTLGKHSREYERLRLSGSCECRGREESPEVLGAMKVRMLQRALGK